VSWQNLRGSKPPIEYARDSHVDVLFEVNELETTALDDTTVKHTFAFTEGEGDGTPLSVPTSLAETCRDYELKAHQAKAAALTGSIDIKTVAVSDGRDRWHYLKTEERALDRTYPRVTFAAPNKPSVLQRVLLTVGAASLGAGLGLWLGEQASMDDPSTPGNEKIDTGGWSTNLMVVGGAATIAALAVAAGGGEKPDPSMVLCNGKFAVATAAEAPKAEVVSSEHTFEQTTTGDALADAKKQVMARMTTQFIDQLKEAHALHLHQTAPPPAAPAAAPAPAAPPAAAPAPAPAPVPAKP
jgi:hypothetical protein